MLLAAAVAGQFKRSAAGVVAASCPSAMIKWILLCGSLVFERS